MLHPAKVKLLFRVALIPKNSTFRHEKGHFLLKIPFFLRITPPNFTLFHNIFANNEIKK